RSGAQVGRASGSQDSRACGQGGASHGQCAAGGGGECPAHNPHCAPTRAGRGGAWDESAAVERVVSARAEEPIAPRAAGEDVIADPGDAIDLEQTNDGAIVAEQHVVIQPAEKSVVAHTTGQPIAAAVTVQCIVVRATQENVVAIFSA